MNIETALDEFCTEQEANGNSARTIGTYRQRVMKMVRWLIAHHHGRTLDRCTRPALNAYIAWLRHNNTRHADNPYRPTQHGRLSPKTVNSHLRDLKTFFNWCVELDYMNKNPVAHLKKIKTEHGQKQKMMAYADYKRLLHIALDMADSDQPRHIRDAAMWLMVADSACRSGELISMSNTTCKKSAGLNLWSAWVHESKTSEGYIYYTNETAAVLEKWLEIRPLCNHSFLWCGLNSRSFKRPLKTGGVYQAFERIAAEGGVQRNFSPHALRHLNGWWYTKKYGVIVAQHKLRHSSHVVTGLFYSNVDDTEVMQYTRSGSLVNRAIR